MDRYIWIDVYAHLTCVSIFIHDFPATFVRLPMPSCDRHSHGVLFPGAPGAARVRDGTNYYYHHYYYYCYYYGGAAG